MLGINLFRVEKGNNPDVIRELQRRRFKDAPVVDEVIALNQEVLLCGCVGQFELDNIRKDFNQINKIVAKLKLRLSSGSSYGTFYSEVLVDSFP
ncbi:hypothetical protein AgCh_027406 [Apium graveolens]